MPIDTLSKRFSMAGADGVEQFLPAPDGSFITRDRQQLVGLYNGLATDPPVGGFAFGAVTYGKTSGEQTQLLLTGHVVSAGEQLLVYANPYDPPFTQIASVKWLSGGAGQTLTAIAGQTDFSGTSNVVFLLTAPIAGTFTVEINLTSVRWSVAVAISCSGIDFSTVATTLANAGDIGTTISRSNIVTSPGRLLIDFARSELATPGWSVGAGQTVLGTPTSTATLPNNLASSWKVAATESETMQWTQSSVAFWGTSVLYGAKITGPTGGGTVPPGTNPPAGTLPSTTPQVCMVIDDIDDGTVLDSLAEADGGPFSDDADAPLPGYKEARIIQIAAIRRAYPTEAGGMQASAWKAVAIDTDRKYRGYYGSTSVRGKKASFYVINHPDRINKLVWFRFAAGIITDHGGGDDFTYEFDIQGMLARHSSAKRREKKVPQNILKPPEFPLLKDKHASGYFPPILYGELSDENQASPAGVVPGTVVAQVNLTFFGGINKLCYALSFAGHSCQKLIDLFYNLPGSPDVRVRVPSSAYGQATGAVWAPDKPFWTEAIPSGTRHVEYQGFRHFIVFVDAAHALAPAILDGRSQITANMRGTEDVGDGTGNLIEAPSRVLQHFWTNFIENSYKTGNWFAIPTFGTYSLFDSTRIEAAKTYSDTLKAGGLKVAIRIGGNQQETVFDVAKKVIVSGDLEVAENRHGQIVADHENPAAVATITITDQHDAIRFRTRTNRAAYANVVRFRYGLRYIEPAAPQATPPAGDALPKTPVAEYDPWLSGLVVLKHTAAIAANNGEEVYLDLDLYGVYDTATAEIIAERALTRAVGPNREGPVEATITTGWQAVGFNGVTIDLNTVLGVTHAEGLGTSGWTDKRIRVREVVAADALKGLWELGGREIDSALL